MGVQELSRTFLLINIFTLPIFLLFLLFSLTANLCDVPLSGLLAASEVGCSFDKTRYQRFRSDCNLYGLCRRALFRIRCLSKRALRAILLIVIIQVATTTTVVICPESFLKKLNKKKSYSPQKKKKKKKFFPPKKKKKKKKKKS